VERAAIREEPESKPYRRVRVEPLADVMPLDSRPQVQAATSELVALAEQVAREREPLRAALTNLENVHLHPGIIADQVASLIVKDPYERQSLLEEREVCRRVRLVCVQLRRALSRTDGSASPTESGLE
jgi:ATP-dependent Lon protease